MAGWSRVLASSASPPPLPESISSKIDPWPAILSACARWPYCAICSSIDSSSIPIRVSPSESSAPHLISASSPRLFISCESTRQTKSHTDSNGPFSSRSATIARAHVSPTFLTAFRPKRIFPSTTAKSVCEVFTSGGSTSIPISWHAFT